MNNIYFKKPKLAAIPVEGIWRGGIVYQNTFIDGSSGEAIPINDVINLAKENSPALIINEEWDNFESKIFELVCGDQGRIKVINNTSFEDFEY